MSRILFLAHRIPYPPNKGDKIRSWHILKYLAKRHDVYLGCFIDDPQDAQYAKNVADICKDAVFVPLNRTWATLKSMKGLLTRQSLSMSFYVHQDMAQWVEGVFKTTPIDMVYVYSSTMAQYALRSNMNTTPFIMDFVDVDSQKWAQYAKEKPWPLRWVYKREAKYLLSEERAIAGKASQSLFVSEEEAALFRSLAPEVQTARALRNGVDLSAFDRANVPDIDLGDGPVISFTGAMDYWANINAVQWFVEKCWPAILKQAPNAQFYIVGSNPDIKVQALANEQIHVTGRVDQVQPYMKASTVAVAPMRIARGVQNKVLEAMAMACPVVTTQAGAEGLGLVHGEDVLIADDVEGFVRSILSIVADKPYGQMLAKAARVKALKDFSWDHCLRPLENLLGSPQSLGDKLADLGD